MKSDMFIDPKSDYAFKRFFGTVSNKELTIGFLNSLLNKDIKDIIFHNVEMQGNNTDSRKAVFDLFCEGSDGELFIVEIQKKRQKYFSDRVLYYASFVIQMQADIESEKFRLAKEEEKKQGTRKKREKTGTGWKDKGMAVRTAERKKRKNCNYAIRLSLTAKSVAEEMGISRQQLCNIEQSETAPVVVKYIAFLRSKGVDLNALFDRIIVNK